MLNASCEYMPSDANIISVLPSVLKSVNSLFFLNFSKPKGTGNNNKINWAFNDKQEFIDIVEVIYRGARKGRGLVVSPKDYSTKYRY